MHPRGGGGAERDRTADLLTASQALSQLSYGPESGEYDGAESSVSDEHAQAARRCDSQ